MASTPAGQPLLLVGTRDTEWQDADRVSDRLAAWREAFPQLDEAVAHELQANLDVRWTHHSTAIEGNRLAYSDVAQVLLRGLTSVGHAHALRDVDEVRGHAEAIATVRRWMDEHGDPEPAPQPTAPCCDPPGPVNARP